MLSASIVASALLLLLAAGAYFRESRRGTTGSGSVRALAGLFALRVAAVLVLFLVLSGLVIRHRWSRPGRVVAVLQDVSRSMTLVGADSLATRAIERMRVTFDAKYELFAFAESTVVVGGEFPATAEAAGLDGTRSLLAAALDAVARRQPGAILLLTDGRDNGPSDPVREAARVGIPVYAVGCGLRRVVNLKLAGLRLPEEIYAGETARVVVRADWSGPGPAEAGLELAGRRGQLAFADMGTQEAKFELVFPEPGFRQLRAIADSVPGEITAADNVMEAVCHVRSGRVRVSYLTDAPGPSSRFVTRALERLPRVGLVRAIAATPGGLSLPGDADVHILDRLRVGPEWPGWDRLAEAVSSGAGLLVLNERGFDAGHPLARFVPGGAVLLRGPVRVEPTPGRPVEALARLLDRLPPLEPAAVPSRPDSFEAWLRVPAEARAGAVAGGQVVAGARSMGRGRVLYLGWSTWRWGFTSGDIAGAPTALDQLLEPAIRFLSTGTGELLRLAAVRPAFMAGDPVQLELSVIAPDGRPLTGVNPTVAVRETDDALSGEAGVELGPLPMVELGGGRYQVMVAGLGPGSYRATGTTTSGEAEAGFAVVHGTREETMLGLDDRLLREIARVTGGRYFDSDSLPGPGFEMQLAPSRHGFEFTPRRSVWTYLLLVLLAGTEWALRRRKGLL